MVGVYSRLLLLCRPSDRVGLTLKVTDRHQYSGHKIDSLLTRKRSLPWKNDFIYHIKASNMFSLFESIDPDSHSRWQTLAVTAFKSVSEKLQVESKDPTFQVI